MPQKKIKSKKIESISSFLPEIGGLGEKMSVATYPEVILIFDVEIWLVEVTKFWAIFSCRFSGLFSTNGPLRVKWNPFSIKAASLQLSLLQG